MCYLFINIGGCVMKSISVAVLVGLLASMSVAVPEQSASAWASEGSAANAVESGSPNHPSYMSSDSEGPGAGVIGVDEVSFFKQMTGPRNREEQPDDTVVQIQPTVVGGSNYEITQAPWQVALIDPRGGSNFEGQFCGGSIYSQYWIITAAHCLTGKSTSNIRILAGRATLGSDLSPLAVSQILVHPEYNDTTLANDIALLRVATPLTFSSSIAAIGLATSIPQAGTPAVITGWGETWIRSPGGFYWDYYGSPRYPDHLQGATVAIQSSSFCGSPSQWGSQFNSRMMVCAAVPGYWQDICFGDSGGPLAVNLGGRWVLVGVTSFVSGCAWSSAGVYANVVSYRSWISSNALLPGVAPTLSSSISTPGGFSFNVTNYDRSHSYSAQVVGGAGRVSVGSAAGSSLPITVSGVAPGASATVRVTAFRSGYTPGSNEASGSAQGPFDVSPVPIITGFAVVGQMLTASVGEWTPAPTTVAYQWLLNGQPISRATGSTYVVGSKDVGRKVSVRVTGSRAFYLSTVRESSQTSAISATMPFTQSPTPTITGTAIEGHTLTAQTGSWDPQPTFTYQWLSNKSPINSANASTYALKTTDFGKRISVRVVATLFGYTTTTVTSTQTSAISPGVSFASTSTPTISGFAVVGQTLTASAGSWSPEPNFSYQWLASNKVISGANGSTYVVRSADLNKPITVRVTATKAGYAATSLVSAATSAVARTMPFTQSPTPTITGSTILGQTLTASVTGWNPQPTGFTYQWLRNGSNINRATGSTYTLTSADLGRLISVRVVATLSGYTTTPVTSTQTSAISP